MMEVALDIRAKESVTAAAEKAIEQYIEKLEQVLQKLVLEERGKIIDEGIENGGWLFNYIYDAVKNGIYRAVYNVYSPKMYDRRYESSGGLASADVLEITVSQDKRWARVRNTAECRPVYKPAASSLEQIIIQGLTYPLWGTNGAYLSPRNFYAAAQKFYKVDAVHKELENLLQQKAQGLLQQAQEQIER